MTKDPKLAEQIKRDYRQAGLDPKTRALLDYAVQVTHDPHPVTAETIAGLRQLGWSDEDILTATHIIGFFNYYTRLADALGVEPEDFMKRE
ncbi:MAG: peroxidase [Acidobacteria bacterium]|nr:peroxidase [Acidobacteriota bacterium]